MKYWLIFLFSCLSLLTAPGMAPADEQPPALQMAVREFDFGEVNEGSVVSHEFTVGNAGPGPLKILSVHPG
jgi:hypothetical protein